MINQHSLVTRDYDRFLPPSLLPAIKARRTQPDGDPHTVYEKFDQMGVSRYDYRWRKMKLGDFFIVAIGDRSVKAMRMGFLAAARRNDFELAIVRVVPSSGQFKGEPCLRVTLTYFGVDALRQRARNG